MSQVGLAERPEITSKLNALRTASRALRALPTVGKNQVLEAVARGLLARQSEILEANSEDLKALLESADSAFRDRLLLNEQRLVQMAESLRQVAAFPDPVGEVVERRRLVNGLDVSR